MTQQDPSFQRTDTVNQPGIVGAKWWQQGVQQHAAAAVPRRNALALIVAGGAAVAVVGALGVCGIAMMSDDEVEFTTVDKMALETQRLHGWNFGAVPEPLVFDGKTVSPFDPSSFTKLRADLEPARRDLRPYYWPTLFEAPTAMPRQPIEGESPTAPLLSVLKPIFTSSMDQAYRRGLALAKLFEKAPNDIAVALDMTGPDAVAFAAGMAQRFDPVFTFDNWPHPRGVVKSHNALAAAAYYQPLFSKSKASRASDARPVFVMDRTRLAAYTDETKQFDNRYVAKLPPATKLTGLGVKKLLYVVPTPQDVPELDDLNADFIEFKNASVDVRMVAATDFSPDTSTAPPDERKELEQAGDWPPYYYGGDAGGGDGFWVDYGDWDPGYKPSKQLKSNTSRRSSTLKSYSPSSRTTMFSSSKSSAGNADGTGTATKTASGARFGAVAVAVAAGTGVVLGTRYGAGRTSGPRSGGRSGSFGRSSGRSGG